MKMNYAFCLATHNKYMIHRLFPHNWAHRNTCEMGKVVVIGHTHTHTHNHTGKVDKNNGKDVLLMLISNKY